MNSQKGLAINAVLIIILISLALVLSGGAIYLGSLSKKNNSTDTTAGTDEQREFTLKSSKTPSSTRTFKKGEEVISEGTLLKYPQDRQSYPGALYIKKDNGLEYLINVAELADDPNFTLGDYLNKKVRVTGYLIPVAPQSGSSYPFETSLVVEKIEIL